jgi:hypothetical protein
VIFRKVHFGVVTMPLVPGTPVVARFAGDRDTCAPMTLGQRNIAQWLSAAPDHRYAALHWTLDVPPGTSLDELAGAFSVLLRRHEGLRTVYFGQTLAQRVIRTGALAIEVHHETADVAVDGDAVAAELLAAVAAPSTSDGDGPDLPLRVAVAVHGGTVRAAVIRYSHLAVDLHAMAVVGRELGQLLGSPAPRGVARPPVPPPPGPHQPVDLAGAEAAPAMRGRREAALDRWEEYLRRMPASLYAAPRAGTGSGSGAVQLSSAAAAMALRHVHARTRTSPPSVVLAAVCAVLARRAGYTELMLPVLSSNRFRSELANYVGTLVQTTMFALDLGGAGFDTLARRTHAAMLHGARLGVYDAYRLTTLRLAVEYERGTALNLEPVFNNLVLDGGRPRPRPAGPVEALAAATARTRLRWQPMPGLSTPLSVELLQVDGVLRLRLCSADLSRAGRDELEALLLAVERVLVAAAGADLDCSAVHEVIALEPLYRGPGWLYLDHSWVDLAEVRRLVADTCAPAVTGVFATDPAGLVAYLAVDPALRQAAGPARGPGDAHARCLAALPGRVGALAPRRYVVCAGVPEDAGDEAAWRRLPVLAEGTGRSAARAATEPTAPWRSTGSGPTGGREGSSGSAGTPPARRP